VLITAVLQKELWCVPATEAGAEVNPVLVHTFEHLITGIVEIEPDVFIVCLSEAYTTHESHLARVDLSDWGPGDPVAPEIIYTFDDRARGLNGACLLGPGGDPDAGVAPPPQPAPAIPACLRVNGWPPCGWRSSHPAMTRRPGWPAGTRRRWRCSMPGPAMPCFRSSPPPSPTR
jgi:hypothetical protein